MVPSSRLERGVSGGTYFGSILCDPGPSKDWGADEGVSIWCGRFLLGFSGVGCLCHPGVRESI